MPATQRTPLARLLYQQGRTNRWLAGKLKCHESTVSRYCKGLIPSAGEQRKIARLLETTVEALWPVQEDQA